MSRELMLRTFQSACCLILFAALASAEQAAKGGSEALRPNPPKNSINKGVPKGVPKKGGPRISNPTSWAARLFRASPEQRERVLEKLPVDRQERMRRELAWFDGLPKDQQQQVLGRSERLAALPPEKQRAVSEQLRALNRLPLDRSRAVRQAILRLQGVPDDQREGILSGESFLTQFSTEELQIISDLVAIMPPPR